MSQIQIDGAVSAPFMENTWIVRIADRSECVLIDPGFQPEILIRTLELRRLTPSAIVLTHGHVDHIAGNGAVVARWPGLPILIGERDAVMLTDARANLSGLGGMPVVSPPATRLLKEGDVVDQAGLHLDVLEIPGHSPGHVVYVLRDCSPWVVLGGDVLFQGSIGRTDFPGGDHRLLLAGIRAKLYTLPDDTIVYPGHGDPTTIGEEKATNPFCPA